ncbi:hypothetical protein [Streptomyces canus]|uniref:hypothetical protein n=1 Tax=Streptomyces canus TaxID=58343 RepID=UPI0038078D0C
MPCLADLLTLQRVPAPTFGLLTSVDPAPAATAGWLALGQRLGWTEWAGMTAVASPNTIGVLAPQETR